MDWFGVANTILAVPAVQELLVGFLVWALTGILRAASARSKIAAQVAKEAFVDDRLTRAVQYAVSTTSTVLGEDGKISVNAANALLPVACQYVERLAPEVSAHLAADLRRGVPDRLLPRLTAKVAELGYAPVGAMMHTIHGL